MRSKRTKTAPAPKPDSKGLGAIRKWLSKNLGKAGPRLVALVALFGLIAWYGMPAAEPQMAGTTQSKGGSSFQQMPDRSDGPTAPLASISEQQRRAELVQQLELLDHTLCSYREATKYPNSSRPISEHPDQVYPNRAIAEQHAMRKEGGGVDPAIQIQTTQSRVYMAEGETVLFSIRAVDKEGQVLPLSVSRTLARGISAPGARDAPQLALSIMDDGSGGDAVAGDGTYSGTLAPAHSGFAGFDGTIRTELRYNVAGQTGIVLFDVIYSPETPATWTGAVREVLEDGALNFYLKANVRMPGRYIVTGRVDDAKGKPLALLTFNDLLGQGSNEIRLTLVGKLLHDLAPVFPLSLRDVDAYLLKENTDPDRALMPRREGAVHQTKTYALKNFSDREWDSEERSRYLNEYSKDLEMAKAALVAFDPGQARMPFPQSACSLGQQAAPLALIK